MITNLKQFKESKLVPRNLDGRTEKLRQQNLKLLQQEVIEGDIRLDDMWDFTSDQVRTRIVNGNVKVKVTNARIPKWLENVTVNDSFYCSYNQLTSLEGCPKTVNGYFLCSNNKLTSLEGCPEYIEGNFLCNSNKLTSLKFLPKYIGGHIYCHHNSKEFTQEDIPKETIIKGKIIF